MKPLYKTVDDGSGAEIERQRSSRLPVLALTGLVIAILALVVWGIVSLAAVGQGAVGT